MQKNFKTAFNPFILIALIVFSGCQRELDSGPVGGNPTNNSGMVTASVRGIVIDENNQPVAGATVVNGTNTTTTDRYGVFSFNNIRLERGNGYVRVEKSGYFNGNRSFVASEGRRHHVRIRLLPRTINGTFSASSGGTVSLSNGAKLVMPASAVVDKSGNTYSGNVDVSMVWINPTATNLPEIIQGDLRGVTTSGNEVGLETYGMLGVELSGAGNISLNLATGKTAELTFPIPFTLRPSAPSTIDLWYFNEISGKWVQEGSATRVGNNYIGNVNHFSFWNCDAPFPTIQLCVNLVTGSPATPLNNVQLRLKRLNGTYSFAYTDSSGKACGLVPKNESLTLEVLDICNNVIVSQTIGPFSANSSLTVPVTIPAVNTITITGVVTNCSGNNVTSGTVFIYTSGPHSYTAQVNNGNFSTTILNCSNTSLNFTVTPLDYSNYQSGPSISGSGISGIVNVGTIQACGSASAEYLEYFINGNIYSFIKPPHFLQDSTVGSPPSGQSLIQAAIPSNGQLTHYAYLAFQNNGVTGTVPVFSGYIKYGPQLFLNYFQPSSTLNLTSVGPPGTFMEGNFTNQMSYNNWPPFYTVVCHFRVRRR